MLLQSDCEVSSSSICSHYFPRPTAKWIFFGVLRVLVSEVQRIVIPTGQSDSVQRQQNQITFYHGFFKCKRKHYSVPFMVPALMSRMLNHIWLMKSANKVALSRCSAITLCTTDLRLDKTWWGFGPRIFPVSLSSSSFLGFKHCRDEAKVGKHSSGMGLFLQQKNKQNIMYVYNLLIMAKMCMRLGLWQQI